MLFIQILNYNTGKETVRLFKHIEALKIEGAFVIVLDNNSAAEDQEILRKYIPAENLQLLNRNSGYAGGNNVGLKLAIARNAQYALILNPDIELKTDTIQILLERISSSDRIAAIGPRILEYEKPNIIYSDGGFTDPVSGFYGSHLNTGKDAAIVSAYPAPEEKKAAYVNGSFLMINLACMADVGFFREDFFLYYEETDWCLRCLQKGWKIEIDRSATAFHKRSSKGGTYFYYLTRNRMWMCKLYKGNISASLMHSIKELMIILVRGSKGNSRFKTALSLARGVYEGFRSMPSQVRLEPAV